MIKKLIVLFSKMTVSFACFLILLGTFCLPVFAESGTCGESVSWDLSNGVLTVSGSGDMYDFKDNEFGPWYDNRYLITEVVVEKGVTSVGNNAFFDCNNLVKVTLADSVTSIGSFAFMECDNLRVIKFGKVSSIGPYAFKFCYSIQSLSLPDTLKFIGLEAFQGCKSLASLTIPSSVTEMQESVFSYCTDLMQVTVNASIAELPMWTFYGCESLVNVSFSPTITVTGDSAFHSCDQLSHVSSTASEDVTQQLTSSIREDVPSFSGVNGDPIGSSSFVNSGDVLQKDVIDEEDAFVKGTLNQEQSQIDASVNGNSGWETVINRTEEYVNTQEYLNQKDPVEVNVQIQNGLKVDKEVIKSLAGQNVTLNLEFNGLKATIECSDLDEDKRYTDLDLDYVLEMIHEASDAMQSVLKGADAYSLSFKGYADYPMTIKIPLGLNYANGYATLYEYVDKEWKLIHSVRIDSKGNATLYLNGFDPLTKYMIGLNVEGINITNAYIPSELYSDYGGLIDEHGNMYEVTGIQSKWGITLSQFSFIVFGALGGVIVLVGLVMFIIFKMQQNKEKIRREVTNESKNKK